MVIRINQYMRAEEVDGDKDKYQIMTKADTNNFMAGLTLHYRN